MSYKRWRNWRGKCCLSLTGGNAGLASLSCFDRYCVDVRPDMDDRGGEVHSFYCDTLSAQESARFVPAGNNLEVETPPILSRGGSLEMHLTSRDGGIEATGVSSAQAQVVTSIQFGASSETIPRGLWRMFSKMGLWPPNENAANDVFSGASSSTDAAGGGGATGDDVVVPGVDPLQGWSKGSDEEDRGAVGGGTDRCGAGTLLSLAQSVPGQDHCEADGAKTAVRERAEGFVFCPQHDAEEGITGGDRGGETDRVLIAVRHWSSICSALRTMCWCIGKRVMIRSRRS